ncbi:hypothetical protein JCM3775_003278 [Rhodotorula graminis]
MPKRPRPHDAQEPHPPPRLAGGAGAIVRDASHQAAERTEGVSSAQLRFKGSSNSTRAPPAKRPRTTALPLLSLEGSLSEEILLRCLSFLGAHDLVTVSRVSSAWWRLSQDPQLWRSLYLRTYASPSVRRRAFAGENVAKTRPWRELFKVSTNWRTGSARTSTLGKGIRKAVLPEAPRDLSIRPAEVPPVPALPSPSVAPSPVEDADTLLQFHHNYILSASRTPTTGDDIPSVTVHRTLAAGDSAVVGSVTSTRLSAYFAARPDFRPPLSITEMRLDEDPSSSSTAVPWARGPLLAVFFSTGQFSLFRLTLPSPTDPFVPFSAHEVYASLALGAPPAYPFAAASAPPSSPFDPVVLARLHGPILVTLSREMTMRFWSLSRVARWAGESLDEESVDEVQLEEAETPLQTRESWSPVVLSLRREASHRAKLIGDPEPLGDRFTVSLAYSAPVFPATWTVGLQEFLVTLEPPSPSPSLARVSKIHIVARNATALPAHAALPSTPRRTAPLLATSSSPPPAPRNPVTSIEHSHPFIVTSRADNTLDVYEVVAAPAPGPSPRPPRPSSSARLVPETRPAAPALPPLRIVHRRTLFGHTARVASVALRPSLVAAAGPGVKCISAGDDGAVKVWSLVPTPAAGSKRAREGTVHEEAVIDVRAAPGDLEGEGERGDEREGSAAPTAWQRMKRRRSAGVRAQDPPSGSQARERRRGEDEAPQRVRRVWVEEDKIVVAERARDGRGEETVRVLRFD